MASSGIGLKQVVTVAADAPVLDALKLLQKHNISGVNLRGGIYTFTYIHTTVHKPYIHTYNHTHP